MVWDVTVNCIFISFSDFSLPVYRKTIDFCIFHMLLKNRSCRVLHFHIAWEYNVRGYSLSVNHLCISLGFHSLQCIGWKSPPKNRVNTSICPKSSSGWFIHAFNNKYLLPVYYARHCPRNQESSNKPGRCNICLNGPVILRYGLLQVW